MSIISIGNLTSKMIYPLLMGIFSFFSLIIYKLLRNVPYTKKGGQIDYFHQKPFRIAWVMCLAEASCSFLFFNQKIRNYISKQNKDNTEVNNKSIFQGENKLRTIIMLNRLLFHYNFINIKRD